METNFNVFYCTVCHVCKSLPDCVEPKFCSGCKLVQYCCSLHQKEDWPNHKDFCKAIKRILTKTGHSHIFKEALEFTEKDSVCWIKLRESVVKLVESILKRSLSFVETQILLFPPVCNFCFSYEQNKMFSCYVCNTVMYCCKEHQNIDVKHKDVCNLLFLSYKIDTQRFFNQMTAYNFNTLLKLKFKKFPENMGKIFNIHSKNVSCEEMLLSEPLSYLATLAFAICQVRNKLVNRLTVHIVGADSMELFAISTLPVIFQLMPCLTDLNIVLIGPNLPSSFSFSAPSEIYDKCSVYVVSKTFYHSYVSDDNVVRPDVVAVFNCGFNEFVDEPDIDTWKTSLPCILSFCDSTVLLTSYTAQESVLDLKRICQAGHNNNKNFEVLMESKLNPFGSLYPHRDWEAENSGVFFVNKYMSLLVTK